MSRSTQCDLVASYMDGVHVKIAEAYKPPRKVCLPAAYNNRLPNVSKLTYDFSLERSVLEKMTEWHKARQASSKARQARLDEKRKKEKEKAENSQSENLKPVPAPVPVPVPEPTILTPQPLSPPVNDLQLISDCLTKNTLDYSDFDNDTSSPFDNVELKTLNDMEELALVLQPVSQWTPPAKLQGLLNELTMNDQPETGKDETNEASRVIKNQSSGEEEEIEEEKEEKQRCVATIVEELEREILGPVLESRKKSPESNGISLPEDSAVTSQHLQELEQNRLLSNLTEDEEKLARRLSDMGFSLGRVVRAIEKLETQDDKKLVEYLLAVQSLEESGIPGEEAEKALLLTDQDQGKAKEYYKNLSTLKGLGFEQEKVQEALLKCNFDRDAALDFLIS